MMMKIASNSFDNSRAFLYSKKIFADNLGKLRNENDMLTGVARCVCTLEMTNIYLCFWHKHVCFRMTVILANAPSFSRKNS